MRDILIIVSGVISTRLKMKNLMVSLLITAYVWLFFIITLIPFFLIYLLIWIITLPFDRKKFCCHYFTGLWAGLYIFINPWWKVVIENRFKMHDDQAYIILANHQSLLDALAIYRLHFHFRWISKQELFRIPVIGWVLAMNRHIPVIRGDKESKEYMIRHAIDSLSEGVSVLIFPEGTRTMDGNIREFREGAFYIALEAKVPLLPMVIDGAFDALPKNSLLFPRKKHIMIKLLDPVRPEEYLDMPLPLLMKKMETLMSTELVRLRNENILLHHD